jgi:EAL domain-containing protein (putative c-di-GMP-specific phosphodiesterase class I)
VSVNLSPRNCGTAWLDDLRDMLHTYRVPTRRASRWRSPNPCCWALTSEMLATLQDIAALGLSIALDDFGTGYSNLAYLQRFSDPHAQDRPQLRAGLAANRPLADLIVELCRLMNLTAVAEGVETEEQLEWVREHGIGQCQGFL